MQTNGLLRLVNYADRQYQTNVLSRYSVSNVIKELYCRWNVDVVTIRCLDIVQELWARSAHILFDDAIKESQCGCANRLRCLMCYM